jgi:hypothetical protein
MPKKPAVPPPTVELDAIEIAQTVETLFARFPKIAKGLAPADAVGLGVRICGVAVGRHLARSLEHVAGSLSMFAAELQQLIDSEPIDPDQDDDDDDDQDDDDDDDPGVEWTQGRRSA